MQPFSLAILEVDAAAELLDMNDKDLGLDARDSYRKEYAEHMTSFRLAAEKKSKRKKVTAQQKGTLPTSISQKEASLYIPPGSYTWRERVSGSWQGHLKPFALVFESWAKTNEQEAMRRVIRSLWDQYLIVQALSRDACPWVGVWEPAAEQSLASGYGAGVGAPAR